MNVVLKTVLVVLFFSLSSLSNLSWAKEGPRQMKQYDAQKHIERLTKKLDLSDEQVPKVKAVLEARHQQLTELREQAKQMKDSGMSRKQVREALKEQHQKIKQDSQLQLKNILTTEQSEKLDEMHEKRKMKRDEMREKRQQRSEKDNI